MPNRLQGAHRGNNGSARSVTGTAAVAVPDNALDVRVRRHRRCARRATDAAHLLQALRD